MLMSKISKEQGRFRVEVWMDLFYGDRVTCHRGKAMPASGSDGNGYSLRKD